jgi:hypothetical protein
MKGLGWGGGLLEQYIERGTSVIVKLEMRNKVLVGTLQGNRFLGRHIYGWVGR